MSEESLIVLPEDLQEGDRVMLGTEYHDIESIQYTLILGKSSVWKLRLINSHPINPLDLPTLAMEVSGSTKLHILRPEKEE